MYNILRKHSEDAEAHIVDTAGTKLEATTKIAQMVKELVSQSTMQTKVQTLAPVTNVKFTSQYASGVSYSIGFWPERAD